MSRHFVEAKPLVAHSVKKGVLLTMNLWSRRTPPSQECFQQPLNTVRSVNTHLVEKEFSFRKVLRRPRPYPMSASSRRNIPLRFSHSTYKFLLPHGWTPLSSQMTDCPPLHTKGFQKLALKYEDRPPIGTKYSPHHHPPTPNEGKQSELRKYTDRPPSASEWPPWLFALTERERKHVQESASSILHAHDFHETRTSKMLKLNPRSARLARNV